MPTVAAEVAGGFRAGQRSLRCEQSLRVDSFSLLLSKSTHRRDHRLRGCSFISRSDSGRAFPTYRGQNVTILGDLTPHSITTSAGSETPRYFPAGVVRTIERLTPVDSRRPPTACNVRCHLDANRSPREEVLNHRRHTAGIRAEPTVIVLVGLRRKMALHRFGLEGSQPSVGTAPRPHRLAVPAYQWRRSSYE